MRTHSRDRFIYDQGTALRLKYSHATNRETKSREASIRSKVLILTPEDRKKLGINKSTLWYMQKHVREGKRIKVYGKVMGKIK